MTRSNSRDFDEFPVKDFVAFDLETSGLSPETDEILEIGMVKFMQGKPVEKWSTLVRPSKTPSLKVLRLTNISAKELESSPPISEVCESVVCFGKGLPLVGHNPQFDISFLTKVIPEFQPAVVYDTLELAKVIMPDQSGYKLTELAGTLGISLDQAHRACDDALASGFLFIKLMEKILNMPPAVSERIRQVMGEEWPAYQLFTWGSTYYQHTLVNKLFPLEPQVYSGLPGKFPRWFDPSQKGVCVVRSSGTMENAISVAREIARGNKEGRYKISLVGFPHNNELAREIPFLGVPGEYLCLSRLQALELSSRDGGMSGYEMDVRRFYASVFNWASYTTFGHYSGLRIPQGLYSLWSEVACLGDDSCGDTCPFVSQCYLKLANCLASKCPTVMLSWEKAVEPGNEYDIAVVWAFHELDRKIAWNDPWVDIGRLREIACTLVVEDKLPSLDYINRTMEGKLPKGDKVLSGELYRLAGWLAGEMREVQKSFHIRGRPVVSKEHNLFEKFTRDLNEVITNSDGTVPILEPAYRPNGSTALAFSRRTLWPGAKATEMLSQNSRGTYLLSNVADTIAGSSGLRLRYGIAPGIIRGEGEAGSNDLMMVVVAGCETPDIPAFTGKLLLNLAKSVKDACILFPSYGMLKSTYNIVRDDLESMGMVSFAQGVDGGYRVLENVGVPEVYVFARIGPVPDENMEFSPSCLVIPKVPFLPPGTMEELRRKELSRIGEDPFINVSLMSPVLTLKLYVERLKENKKRSLVILSDPKLVSDSSGWRHEFMKYFKELSCINCHFSQVSSIAGKWIYK